VGSAIGDNLLTLSTDLIDCFISGWASFCVWNMGICVCVCVSKYTSVHLRKIGRNDTIIIREHHWS